jgi:uncharacterized lipoprotein YddW (UPF0748 family)
LPATVQQDEIVAMVKRAVNLRCNAILLQVRGFGDRIYKDEILDHTKYYEEPWAKWLNGGRDPGYDPLRDWISECKQAGIELHFWINPFRVDHEVKVKRPGQADVALRTITYNNQTFLDPKEPLVRQYVKDVVAGLVKTYCKHPNRMNRNNGGQGARPLVDDEGGYGVIYDHYIADDGT